MSVLFYGTSAYKRQNGWAKEILAANDNRGEETEPLLYVTNLGKYEGRYDWIYITYINTPIST
jgi:hypothetical protein